MTERFTLLSELGRGGMGVVWKARDEETGKIVALKLLREAYAEDPEYLARFERELELARRIDSAHVVKVLGYGVREKIPYLALEYVDGPSLHAALVQHGPFSWPETRALLIQLTQGLADANAAGVIHRDVKPSNVLLGPDGVAKLTDFGIARGIDLTRLTATSMVLGTPAYMAPEGPRDARSDLYGLGIIGYELLTGAPPFVGTTYQEIILAHLRATPKLNRLPKEARGVIGQLLEKDPARRPQSAGELLAALAGPRGAVSPDSLTVVPARAAAPARKPRGRWQPGTPRRSRLLAGLGAATLVAIVGSTVVAFGAGRPRPTPTTTPTKLAATLTPPTEAPSALASSSPAASTVTPTTAPTPGTFRVTGSMGAATAGNSVAVLAGGRVFVVAGGGKGASGSAEIYDPTTGTFKPVGPMAIPVAGPTVVALRDGRVLLAGGSSESDSSATPVTTAQLYDPTTGKFSQTGSMIIARAAPAASLLSDGRVLITGGLGISGGYAFVLSSAELYDPSTGQFTRTGSTNDPHAGMTSTLLMDGRVLIVGYDSRAVAAAELYDPKTGQFSTTGPLATQRQYHTATLLSDGRVLIAGGERGTDNVALSSAELYDPKTGAFTSTGPMTTARTNQTATLLRDGRVLVAGGTGKDGGTVASAEIYDATSGAFTATGPMSTARAWAAAALLADGSVLVLGGAEGATLDSQVVLDSAEVYAP